MLHIRVLTAIARLRRHAAGPLLVLWDGPPIQRRAEVKEFWAGTDGALQVEPLPASAPDLSPVEWIWQHLKQAQLRNVVCLADDLDRERLAH